MKFRKKKKKIAVGSNPGDKWMAQMIKGQTINFKKLAAMIEKSSTVSKGDALNALDALVASTTWMLQEGHSVKFDGLGTFYPKAKVKAVNTPEEVTADTVLRVGVGFTPETDFKEDMKGVSISVEPLEDEGTPTPP